jgi:Lon-like ATP-dependent protease
VLFRSTQKIEAAYEAGMKNVIIPKANKDDVMVSEKILKEVKIIPVNDIVEVLRACLKDCKAKGVLINQFRGLDKMFE